MGCGKSKDANEDPKFVFIAKPTTVDDVDKVFDAVKTDIDSLEKLRRDLEDTRAEARSISGTVRLKDDKIRFAEACRVFTQAVSACHGGKINNSDIKVEHTIPMLTINTGNLSPDTATLFQLIQDYLQAAVNAPENFKKCFDALKGQQDNLKAMKDTLPDQIKDKGMGEKLKIAQAFAENMAQIVKVLDKANKLRVLADEQQKEQLGIVHDLEDFVKAADVVGAEAAREKLLKPIQIFEKYHKGEKEEETVEKNEADSHILKSFFIKHYPLHLSP